MLPAHSPLESPVSQPVHLRVLMWKKKGVCTQLTIKVPLLPHTTAAYCSDLLSSPRVKPSTSVRKSKGSIGCLCPAYMSLIRIVFVCWQVSGRLALLQAKLSLF